MNTKSLFLSKTFWLQVITLAAALFPACQAWLVANPVPAVALITALNVLVRFVTSGKISISGAGEETMDGGRPGGLPLWVIGAAAVLISGLPSCSAGMPLRIGIQGPHASLSYFSKSGIQMDAVIERHSAK